MLLAASVICFWSHLSSGCGIADSEDVATVRVRQGLLKGRRVSSAARGSYFSFQGVPYAAPPVGPLRFKDPQPPHVWTGVRDALEEGNTCTQFNLFKRNDPYEGDEDCLFLNVYTPCLPSAGLRPLAVMVWIHGGGFVLWSGNSFIYGPDYLVSENVLLVTMNYRLDVFGFLQLGEAAPGNFGLKDQVMALRWVRYNIRAFGGDPGRVTIFGESAGAASVHFHTLSPMSKGLFLRAIAQSGSALNPWAQQMEPAQKALRVARALGCASGGAAAMVECLRAVDGTALLQAALREAPSPQEKQRMLRFIFVPTVDWPVPGRQSFMPKPVQQMMDEGRQHAVGYMTGLNDQEGLLAMIGGFPNYRDQQILNTLDAKWNEKVLPELRLSTDCVKKDAALDALKQFYMEGKPLTQDTLPGYVDLFSDVLFGEGAMYSIRSLAEFSTAPLYVYNFVIDDNLNYFKKLLNISWPGASHADDTGYLFLTKTLPEVPPESSAGIARRRMTRLWTNFAKTGNPTPRNDPLLGVRWQPFTKQQRRFLEIDHQLKPRTAFLAERAAFWEGFYKNFSECTSP